MNLQPASYKLTNWVLDFSDSIPISAEQFEEICTAKQRLIFGVGVEEKIDLVLENYAELERCLLEMALDRSVFPGNIKVLIDGGAHLVNRRIANLLTVTRLYLDHMSHDLSTIYGRDSEPHTAFKDATHTEYDGALGYRVMEALRNHVQHRGLPTHSITLDSRRVEGPETDRVQTRVIPHAKVTTLEENPNFKKSVLAELKETADENDQVDLMPFVREYVEGLSRVHETVRELISADLTAADQVILQYRSTADTKFDGKTSSLAVVGFDAEGKDIVREYVIERPIERRKVLEQKNRTFGLISRRYVSSM